jgi:serine/threonine protein kinase
MSDIQLLEKLTYGDQGEVWRACDVQGTTVACKRFSAAPVWQREQAALTAIPPHPQLIRCLAVRPNVSGWAGQLILEWLSGPTLEELAEQRHGLLPLSGWQRFVQHSLAAIIAVHDAGFLHRDLKPANFLLRASVEDLTQADWVLVDFGNARSWAEASAEPMTGTIHCMAPEQFGKAALDVRTDLYALGCTYYYALTGSFPHQGELTAQVITSHLHLQPKHPCHLRPDLPATQAEWLMRLLARAPAQRPVSAAVAWAQFLDALKFS